MQKMSDMSFLCQQNLLRTETIAPPAQGFSNATFHILKVVKQPELRTLIVCYNKP